MSMTVKFATNNKKSISKCFRCASYIFLAATSFSLTPCFIVVYSDYGMVFNRFNGFPTPSRGARHPTATDQPGNQKPLKRLTDPRFQHYTPLKQGVNERG